MRIRTARWKEVSIDAVVVEVVGEVAVIDVMVGTIVMDAIDVMDVNSWSPRSFCTCFIEYDTNQRAWNTLASMTQWDHEETKGSDNPRPK